MLTMEEHDCGAGGHLHCSGRAHSAASTPSPATAALPARGSYLLFTASQIFNLWQGITIVASNRASHAHCVFSGDKIIPTLEISHCRNK